MSGLPAPGPAGTCVVTGASAGIGADIARELARRGHHVTLVARREERLRDLAAELVRVFGARAAVEAADLADAADRARLIEAIASGDRRVDVLVSNAGTGTHGRFVESDRAAEINQVRLLCEATLDLCAAFAPPMAQRRQGAILIVSSMAGFQPTPNVAGYAACKAFSLSLGEALHAELANSGVVVTTVCPGPVSGTEIFDGPRRHPSQRLPRQLWVSSRAVAEISVDALAQGKRVVVPGRLVQAVAASRYHPGRGLTLRLSNRLYRSR